MAYVIVKTVRELNRLVDKITEAVGTPPSVFLLMDENRQKRVGWRIQHNDMESELLDHMANTEEHDPDTCRFCDQE